MTPRLGRALDADDAAQRARQAAALGDVDNLRTLSLLAAGHSRDEVASAVPDLDTSIARLAAVGLVTPDAVPTGDAWLRFGRLLGDAKRTVVADEPRAAVHLPPAIQAVAGDLAYRFSSTFSQGTVARYVAESHRLLAGRARTQVHLPALTARYAAERLEALAQAEGRNLAATPEILFVCVHNAGRSQMAAAYLRHLAGRRVHVRTAGSSPASAVDPRVTAALHEAGIPAPNDFPKPLTDEIVRAADVVVTMGCGDACPVYPGRRYMDWPLDDPLSLDDVGLRRVRDEIRGRVLALLDELS